jgi:hypothetical protein
MHRASIIARLSAVFIATIVAAACGDGGGAGSGTTRPVATTSTAGETTSTTSAGSSESTSSDDADSSTGTIAELPPHPTACDAPEALIDVAVAVTPDGPMTVDEAWVWFDVCGAGPFVVVAQRPTVDGGDAVEVQIELQADGAPTPWLGTYPAAVKWTPSASGTMELLDPFIDPNEPGTPHPDLHLHAQIEIHAAGYDLSLEVDLIDCGVSDCSCPCR